MSYKDQRVLVVMRINAMNIFEQSFLVLWTRSRSKTTTKTTQNIKTVDEL